MFYGNQLKTFLLLAVLSAILMMLGRLVGGSTGVKLALILALAMNVGAYFFSDKIVLNLYNAQPLDRRQYAQVYNMVEELSVRQGIPMPSLWYLPSSMANAFATGRNPNHSHVAVTEGILKLLNDNELRAVLAHELSHIKNRDILVATVAATIAMAISYVADMARWSFFFGGSKRDQESRGSGMSMVVAAFVMPVAATLVQLAISRSREYMADECGAHACGDPLALASALEKLGASARSQHKQPHSHAASATASLFIVYPFFGNGLSNLFSTHPPMEERIRLLYHMAGRKK